MARRLPPPEEVEPIRALLPPGYRLCAPWRQPKRRHKVRPIYCFKVKPEAQFVQRKGRYTNRCLECHKEHAHADYVRNRRRRLKQTKKWRHDNIEHVRTQQRSEEFKARRRAQETQRYAQRPEVRKARAAYFQAWYAKNRKAILHKAKLRREIKREVEARIHTAPLPLEPVMPYLKLARTIALQEMIEEEATSLGMKDTADRWQSGASTNVTGIARMAQWGDMTPRNMHRILSGKAQSIDQHVLDSILIHTDYSLQEMIDRTLEWADLTADSWPLGYHANGKRSNERSRYLEKMRAA